MCYHQFVNFLQFFFSGFSATYSQLKIYKKAGVFIAQKTYDELEFTDDFMFWNILVYRPDLCKSLIELILDIKVKEIHPPTGQKTIDPKYDTHGIRLDVYVDDDEGTIYDLEMQTAMLDYIPKRSRFYQSIIDMDVLKKGIPYKNLKKSYIIFFCTQDPFGLKLPIYTFEDLCLQDPSLKLNDEAIKIIVNPDSERSSLSSEMNSLLDLLQSKTKLSGLAKNIQDAIIEEKEVKRWEAEYMTLEMKLMDEREEGRLEGISQGHKEAIIECVIDGDLSITRGAEKLGMSEEKFCEAMSQAGYVIP